MISSMVTVGGRWLLISRIERRLHDVVPQPNSAVHDDRIHQLEKSFEPF